MHRVDVVGNSLGVRRELIEGIKSLLGWRREFTKRRPRLAGRLLGVAEKLTGSKPPVSSGCTTVAQTFGQQTTADPLKLDG
ncbi:hypothetical protein GW17_00039623 [Ensete ventricosum]|nr:hypothetical protein GW17_00039623 [Ensete ventricosum]